MSDVFIKPNEEQIRDALGRYAPELAAEAIEFLGEGWDTWAFSAAEHVLRFPKDAGVIDTLEKERRLAPAIAPYVSVPVPSFDVYGATGPNGAPFLGHRRLPGVLVLEAKPAKWSKTLGRDLGRFVRELHAFPVEKALELGVPLDEGPTLRADRMRQYERVIRLVFPLVSCEARSHIEAMYDANLNEPANFHYQPCLVHRDLDSNTLVDPATGALTAVIDFGDAIVSNPAFDFWLPAFGFKRLGIEVQTRPCLEEAGIGDDELRPLLPELEFINFRWPLMDIMHGLEIADESYIEEGIKALNESLPRELRC
ncbi:MAG: phosphotransferase [Dehalococcoidia bacterium]|nr:phosphotransferase [Dehalococcoidia bacterium]